MAKQIIYGEEARKALQREYKIRPVCAGVCVGDVLEEVEAGVDRRAVAHFETSKCEIESFVLNDAANLKLQWWWWCEGERWKRENQRSREGEEWSENERGNKGDKHIYR